MPVAPDDNNGLTGGAPRFERGVDLRGLLPTFLEVSDVGARSINVSTARLARPTLHASSASDRANRNDTVAASNHSPMMTAPRTAMVISRFMSGFNRRSANQQTDTAGSRVRRRASVSSAPAVRC
jgi:hypothetical protein